MKDEKYHDIVRFPFNPDAELDTVIYAADQVKFLYSQKVPADENSARMKVYVVGNVLSGNGSKYPLPKSDTLTYLVSSMTKFIDKTPRYVRKSLPGCGSQYKREFLLSAKRLQPEREHQHKPAGSKESERPDSGTDD